MKKDRKRIWAFALVCALTFGLLSPAANAADGLVEFGSYPQTKVTDESLIAALNDTPQTWKSYGYYSGTTYRDDGTMTPSDYMQYCDVTCGGEKYRGVRITQYRPFYTCYPTLETLTYQKRNGYYTNVTYWFKWQPLVWRWLDRTSGLMLCETIIDGQPFNNYVLRSGEDIYPQYSDGANWGNAQMTCYANNYANSSIRQWLTSETDADSFLNTAFTASQRAEIRWTTLENKAFDDEYSGYDGASTTDKVFLLSYAQALNANYGFRDFNGYDNARKAVSTDYAMCQNEPGGSENSPYTLWWLRTPGETSLVVCSPDADGWITGTFAHANGRGVRPAIRVDPSAVTSHWHTYMPVITATCTEGGDTDYVCPCGRRLTGDHEDALGHNFGEWVVTTPATTETDGEMTRTCARCRVTETRGFSMRTPGFSFFSGGFGTEEDPFLISTAADFDRIDDFYTAFGDDLPSNPVYFTQTADILFYYNDENDNDGSAGYYLYDLYPSDSYTDEHPARPTPAAVLDHAVYDGGGHTIRVASCLVDGEFTGIFGRVTDSTIRNLCARFADVSTDDPAGRMISTAENGYIGFVAFAQNSSFERVEVIFYYNTFELYSSCDAYAEYDNQAPFAGSAQNCSVSDCLAWALDGCGGGFIGGANPTFTSHNTWAMHAGQNVTGVAAIGEEVTCPEIGMHLREDGQIELTHLDGDVMMLYDRNGVIVPRGSDMRYLPDYDPDTTGNVFTFCWAQYHAQFSAGAHGTLTGEGDYGLRVNRADGYCEITGLKPVADEGYVFSGWTNGTNGTLTIGSDGAYTYRIRVDENITGFDAPVGSWADEYFDKAVLTANFAPIPSAALTLSASDDPVYTGDTFDVTVDLTQNPGLAGVSLELIYDSDALTLTAAQTAGMLKTGNPVITPDLSRRPFNILWEDATARTPHTETGTILILTFAVKQTAEPGSTTVTLTYKPNSTFDIDLHKVPMTISGTSFTLIRHTPGDSNGDGGVDLKDVANLARHLVGGWPDVTVDTRNADVDGDGELTLKDVVLVRRFLAGDWGVTLL